MSVSSLAANSKVAGVWRLTVPLMRARTWPNNPAASMADSSLARLAGLSPSTSIAMLFWPVSAFSL
jgi:hypothetical protein